MQLVGLLESPLLWVGQPLPAAQLAVRPQSEELPAMEESSRQQGEGCPWVENPWVCAQGERRCDGS